MLRVFLVFTMKKVALKSDSAVARAVFTTIFVLKRVTAPETSWYRHTGMIDIITRDTTKFKRIIR